MPYVVVEQLPIVWLSHLDWASAMYFYVQQVDIDEASRLHNVILDVATMDDHVRLASLLGGQELSDAYAAENQASMLRFTYIPIGHQGLKEGSWYDVDPIAFSDTRYQSVASDEPSASFLRANLVGVPNENNFTRFLTAPQVANVPPTSLELVVDSNPKGDIELTVVDCGHGNWNEINTTTDRVIYDVGASRWFTKAQVRAVVAGRNLSSESRSISVVISHWDVDHYHALLEFNPAEFAKLRVVFTPSQVPNTETYRRVHKLLTAYGVVLAAVQPASRYGASREIVLEQHWQKGIFTIFRATPGRSRNQTGIVLGILGRNGVALLTGDHHYNKVLAAAGKIAEYGKNPCVLVTPHHGGLAGDPSAAAWLAFFSSLTTPISCGANSHGHPMANVEAELTAMQAGLAPWRTDVSGTWTKLL